MLDLALLKRVNDQVNAAHTWGEPCPADIFDQVYDCENYAYDKRTALLAAGVEPHQMQVIAVRLLDHQEHAVLVVYPDDGGHPWVLDNRFSNVAPMSDLIDFQGYVFLGGTVQDPYTGKTDWARALWLSEQRPTIATPSA